MPLEPPAERHLTHLRDIELRGYERADGLFDIDAHIRDTKTTAIANVDRGGSIAPGEPLHDMWLARHHRRGHDHRRLRSGHRAAAPSPSAQTGRRISTVWSA